MFHSLMADMHGCRIDWLLDDASPASLTTASIFFHSHSWTESQRRLGWSDGKQHSWFLFSLFFFFFFSLMQNCLCFVFVQPKKKRRSVWVDVFSARSSLKCLVLLYRMLFQCMKHASVLMCLQGWVHSFVRGGGLGCYQGLQAPRITSEKSLPKFAPIPTPCNPHDTKTLL